MATKKSGSGAAVAKRPVAKKTAAKKAATRPAKPAEYSWLCPCLAVKDPVASIDLYKKAFGFQERSRIPGPDGKIMHAELTYKDITIMLGPQDGCPDSAQITGPKGQGVCFYLYCEDVDLLARRAKAAGASMKQEPKDMFWGDRTCMFTDADGYSWMFGTNVGECDMSKACEH